MQDNSKVGCFGFAALMLAMYFLWIAILYAGMPLAIILGIVAFQIDKKARENDALIKRDRNKRLDLSFGLFCGAAILFAVSLAGNIFSDQGLFKQSGDSVEGTSMASENSDEDGPEKVSVTPQECAEFRATPQYYPQIKSMCYRMYPSDDWGDAAGRAICETDTREKIEACGVKLILTY